MMTTPTIENARQERDRLLAEAAERDQSIAAAEQQIAAGEAAERATRFDRIVAEMDERADAADTARTDLLRWLDKALFPAAEPQQPAVLAILGEAFKPEVIKVLQEAYRRAIATAERHERAEKTARTVADEDVQADAAALPVENRQAFIERERPARLQCIRRATPPRQIHAAVDSWFDASTPGGAESLLKSLLLAQVVDKHYLDQWTMTLEQRKEQRFRERPAAAAAGQNSLRLPTG